MVRFLGRDSCWCDSSPLMTDCCCWRATPCFTLSATETKINNLLKRCCFFQSDIFVTFKLRRYSALTIAFGRRAAIRSVFVDVVLSCGLISQSINANYPELQTCRVRKRFGGFFCQKLIKNDAACALLDQHNLSQNNKKYGYQTSADDFENKQGNVQTSKRMPQTD